MPMAERKKKPATSDAPAKKPLKPIVYKEDPLKKAISEHSARTIAEGLRFMMQKDPPKKK